MSTDIEREIDFDDALARVFAKVERASKDATNPHFGKPYSTLTAVDDACRGALVAEEFSWPQTLDLRDGDTPGQHITVTTRLRRKGVELASACTLKVEGSGAPQKAGAAITYARRYGLSAAVGVCPTDDDDGHESSKPSSKPQTPASRERADTRGSFDYDQRPGDERPPPEPEESQAEHYARLKLELDTIIASGRLDSAGVFDAAGVDATKPPSLGMLKLLIVKAKEHDTEKNG